MLATAHMYAGNRTESRATEVDSPRCDARVQNSDRKETTAPRPHSASHDQEEQMNRVGSVVKPLTWFFALLMSGLVASCGDGDGNGRLPLGLSSPAGGVCAGASCVNLLTAGNFAILTGAGITNTGAHLTAITGNIGSSPITGAAMNNVFCSEITGTIVGVDAAYVGSGDASCYAGSPADKTTVDNAVADMGTAYAAAAARTPTATDPNATLPIPPGVYNFSTADITINSNVELTGSATDVWIFQITGNFVQAAGTSVILTGGALPQNVFWQVGGGVGVNILAGAHMEGIILAAAGINLVTGASVDGRLFSQTAVALDENAITRP